MQQIFKIGCCGWGYMKSSDLDIKIKINNPTLLQRYATAFDTVEINYTFYRIPKLETVVKWRKEVNQINPDFEFTLKAFQIITHKLRFNETSLRYFDILLEIVKILNSKIILFQSPATFTPKKENLFLVEKFFDKISSEKFLTVWEPRGSWNIETIKSLCENYNIIHCVDPFKESPYISSKQRIVYFRLHGLGERMYSYKFVKTDFENLKDKLNKIPEHIETMYIFFNNTNCYEDAYRFKKLLQFDNN